MSRVTRPAGAPLDDADPTELATTTLTGAPCITVHPDGPWRVLTCPAWHQYIDLGRGEPAVLGPWVVAHEVHEAREEP